MQLISQAFGPRPAYPSQTLVHAPWTENEDVVLLILKIPHDLNNPEYTSIKEFPRFRVVRVMQNL